MLLKTLSRILTEKDELLISPWLFDERKRVTVRLSFSSKNEKYCAYFINKFVSFTSEKVKFNVFWNARKIQSFFPSKDKVQHLSCVISSCGETYVIEAIRICKIDGITIIMSIRVLNLQNIQLETLTMSLVGMFLQEHLKIPSKEEFLKHTL